MPKRNLTSQRRYIVVPTGLALTVAVAGFYIPSDRQVVMSVEALAVLIADSVCVGPNAPHGTPYPDGKVQVMTS